MTSFSNSFHVFYMLPIALAYSIPITVHPHMRGANEDQAIDLLFVRRFIPTCVGQTHQRPVKSALQRRFIPTCVGQTPVKLCHAPSSLRFIPTCVGQTGRSPWPLASRPVHPHMRGANCGCIVRKSDDRGSSPHAWGKRLCRGGKVFFIRFIPTCVGQTRSMRSRNATLNGSSPHAWGKRRCWPLHRRRTPVHPHMRGANADVNDVLARLRRFIPTCVGQTPPGSYPRTQ